MVRFGAAFWVEVAVVSWVCLLGLSGCPRNLGANAVDEAVRVEALSARFTPGDRGDFEATLSVSGAGLQAGGVVGLQWEIWLDNRWFAAGTQQLAESLPDKGRNTFVVRLPVVFRRGAPASDEPTSMEVGIRGGLLVQTGGGVQRLPFQYRTRLEVRYAPSVDLEAGL
ncbi:MAG: hypothetical protein IRZ16_09800 [Myxococcaceae bacterium]|nr:hypothetical protein [Myxococcaceae bacterium]